MSVNAATWDLGGRVGKTSGGEKMLRVPQGVPKKRKQHLFMRLSGLKVKASLWEYH